MLPSAHLEHTRMRKLVASTDDLWYHGSSAKLEGTPRAPLFLAHQESAANWYADNRADSERKYVWVGTVQGKVLDTRHRDGNGLLLEIARSVGVDWHATRCKPAYFDCQAIADNGGNRHNPSDLIYLEPVQKFLLDRGYCGIRLLDDLPAGRIDTLVLVDCQAFRLVTIKDYAHQSGPTP